MENKTFTFENSSSLASCSWSNEILTITFKSGQSYEYRDCPEEVYESLINADSKGKFFQAHIRGKYTEQKL